MDAINKRGDACVMHLLFAKTDQLLTMKPICYYVFRGLIRKGAFVRQWVISESNRIESPIK